MLLPLLGRLRRCLCPLGILNGLLVPLRCLTGLIPLWLQQQQRNLLHLKVLLAKLHRRRGCRDIWLLELLLLLLPLHALLWVWLHIDCPWIEGHSSIGTHRIWILYWLSATTHVGTLESNVLDGK